MPCLLKNTQVAPLFYIQDVLGFVTNVTVIAVCYKALDREAAMLPRIWST